MKSNSKKVDLNNLWIGDVIRILSSNKMGTFEGIGKEGKVRVKHNSKILLVSPNNIEKCSDEEIAEVQDLQLDEWVKPKTESQPFTSKAATNFKNEIDLHITKLNPDLENAHPQLILDHQLVMCRAFLKFSIEKKKNVVTIIHGKGTGALKEEVLHILKEFSNVRFSIGVNGDGAQEVWLKY